VVDAGTGAESPRERNFYRWQVYGLRMEFERIARTGVFFFHRVVNQYLLARKYLATRHETDRKPTHDGRTRAGWQAARRVAKKKENGEQRNQRRQRVASKRKRASSPFAFAPAVQRDERTLLLDLRAKFASGF
jgi:hypothetical protein